MGTEAGPAPTDASHGLLPLEQYSSHWPSWSKTLNNRVEASSYSKWITRAPSTRQDRATSPHPQVMKMLLGGTTSTLAPVTRLQHPASYNHNLSGPLSGSSSVKNLGSRIHESGGITMPPTP